MLYCVFRTPIVFFFLAFKQFDTPKPTQLLENIYTFFSFIQFDSTKPIQLLKKYEKNWFKCIECKKHENYQQQPHAVV